MTCAGFNFVTSSAVRMIHCCLVAEFEVLKSSGVQVPVALFGLADKALLPSAYHVSQYPCVWMLAPLLVNVTSVRSGINWNCSVSDALVLNVNEVPECET